MDLRLLAACHLCSGNEKDWVDILGWFDIHNLALRYFDEINLCLFLSCKYNTRGLILHQNALHMEQRSWRKCYLVSRVFIQEPTRRKHISTQPCYQAMLNVMHKILFYCKPSCSPTTISLEPNLRRACCNLHNITSSILLVHYTWD